MPKKNKRSELAALVAAMFLLVTVSIFIGACADDDLFFPSELMPTSTGEPTSTPTEDDDDS